MFSPPVIVSELEPASSSVESPMPEIWQLTKRLRCPETVTQVEAALGSVAVAPWKNSMLAMRQPLADTVKRLAKVVAVDNGATRERCPIIGPPFTPIRC